MYVMLCYYDMLCKPRDVVLVKICSRVICIHDSINNSNDSNWCCIKNLMIVLLDIVRLPYNHVDILGY